MPWKTQVKTMISLTAVAAGTAVKLFTKGALLAIAFYTAGRANGKDSVEGRNGPRRK